MQIRKQYEELEKQILSPRAICAIDSKGRLEDEPPCPVRTAFQRDRDRIIHSKSFRRLKHKTQVFIKPKEDHFRTRLTHTLEVSQVSRTIARALKLNEDLTEAIALGHDIGHTPFGHVGERALQNACRKYIPDFTFRHNEQSLRVVDVLEKDGKGLNLTYEVRDGILNHSKGSANLTTATNLPLTLEGQIVRISDRIAYINHDIDDAVRAGVINPENLPKEAISALGNSHKKRISTMVIDVINNSQDSEIIQLSPDILAATDKLKDFMFENVYINGKNQTQANEIITALFEYYIAHTDMLEIANENLSYQVRTICDFISGMTDHYAYEKYEAIKYI